MANDAISISKKYPSREKQIDFLREAIQDSEDVPKSGSFVIEGPPCTGKTSTLLEVLSFKKQLYLLINCYECYSSSLLYSKILQELFGKCDSYSHTPVDTFYSFFSVYRKTLRLMGNSQLPHQYFIFKHFDYLEASVINEIMFLEETFPIIWPFSSIFIVTDPICFDKPIYNLSKIHFPRYTQDQLREILLLQRKNYSSKIYPAFLQIFLPWVFEKERNLRDLLRLVDILYPVYKKPIDEAKISENDLHSLFINIEAYLKKYSDVTSLLLFNRIKYENGNCLDRNEKFNNVDLPFYTKYLLLAAYLASYIPPKEDRQLFCRRAMKKKRSLKKKTRTSDHQVNILTGPKPFPLNRLLAIYFSIVEERSNISATLLSQIASLVELKLLIIHGKNENLNRPCYKCVAKFNLVLSVAKTVQFDLEKFIS